MANFFGPSYSMVVNLYQIQNDDIYKLPITDRFPAKINDALCRGKSNPDGGNYNCLWPSDYGMMWSIKSHLPKPMIRDKPKTDIKIENQILKDYNFK